MAEQVPSLSRHDLEAKIVKHCWEDDEFRKEFTADPAGTFVKYLNVPASSLPEISVHEEAPGSWHIVLPARPADAGELTEAELEKISGGTTLTCVVSATLVASPLVTFVSYTVSRDEGGW